MVYMPQKETIDEMIRVNVGIWLEKSINIGNSTEDLLDVANGSLLVKIPSHTIKSLYLKKYIDINLRVGAIDRKSVQGIAIQIYDGPDEKYPIELSFAFTTEHEYELFANMINTSRFMIHFFDERTMMRGFPHHVMTAIGSLSHEQKLIVIEALDRKSEYDPIKSLSEFSQLIQDNSPNKLKVLASCDIRITLNDIQAMTTYEAPLFSKVSLDSEDEGTNFEALIFGCLFPLFANHTYHSPFNSKDKELADILCFDDEFICFVQAKSLSIFGDAKRPFGQRIEKILFDPDPQKPGKAIRQAMGTIREIRSEQPIYTNITKTKQISIPNPRSIPIHALILVSEMHPSVDWVRAANLLVKMSNKMENFFLHIIDLEELQRISAAIPTSNQFNNLLNGRWNTMEVHKNANVIVEFVRDTQNDTPP